MLVRSVFLKFENVLFCILLLVFGSCGVSFVDSFGANNQLDSCKEQNHFNSIWHDFEFFFKNRDTKTYNNFYDNTISFASKIFYLFGFLKLINLNGKMIVKIDFFDKDSIIKNLCAKILPFIGINFF